MKREDEYLVGAEEWDDSFKIVVTDDVEGFGPDLLAKWDGKETPLLRISAKTPEVAGMKYAAQYLPEEANIIEVNTSDRYQVFSLLYPLDDEE